MSNIESPDYSEISAQIGHLQLGIDAAELHGSLCGYLSGGADAPARADWLGKVMADPHAMPVAADSALDRMFVATRAIAGVAGLSASTCCSPTPICPSSNAAMR